MVRSAWFVFALLVCGVFAASAQVPYGWEREWPDTDFSRSSVNFSNIFSGGPPKDGIPAIDDPVFKPVREAAKGLSSVEPVLSVSLNGDARAYPLSILIWHEIVNDQVGEVPVAITFCPLCNSGVVFERTIDGRVTTFGTTGKLRNSDLIMYDRETESWWQQFEGRAIVGSRLGTGLKRVPARLESVANFVERHPDGKILVPPQGARRDYGTNPYQGYDSLDRPFLYKGTYDGPGRALMRVVAVAGKAWSLDYIRSKGSFEEDGVRFTWTSGQASALDSALISEGRDVGTVIVQRRGADDKIDDVVHDIPFAFAFRAFHPDGPIRHLSQ